MAARYVPSKTTARAVNLVPDYITRLCRAGFIESVRERGALVRQRSITQSIRRQAVGGARGVEPQAGWPPQARTSCCWISRCYESSGACSDTRDAQGDTSASKPNTNHLASFSATR